MLKVTKPEKWPDGLPKDFSPYSPPYFHEREPRKEVDDSECLEKIQIEEGQNLGDLDLDFSNYRYMFDVDQGYYDDTPDYYINKYHKAKIPNPNYDKELDAFGVRKAKYEKNLEIWQGHKKIYEEWQTRVKDYQNYKTYLTLKQKYGKEEK